MGYRRPVLVLQMADTMQAHFCVDDQFAFDIVFGQFDEHESRRGVWLVQDKNFF